MVKRIGVIGVGSAGIQALCHFCAWLDNNWEITSIHDPSIPILGIGESTNPSFITALQHGVDFDIIEDLTKLSATHKFGTKYENWRNHSFVNPLLSGNVAIHFDTYSLKEFALPRLHKKWKTKLKQIEGNVTNVYCDYNKAYVTIDGIENHFDFIVDCRGFPKTYDDYTVIDNNPVNYGLVHNIPIGADWKYTKHIATQDGWMFALPLADRQSYGYMFNDTITDVQTAKENFSKEINVPVDELQDIKYKFKSYYANKMIDGRIIKNGNTAVFFEPMFANSLWMYDRINRYTYDYVMSFDKFENPQHAEAISGAWNNLFTSSAKQVEEMIAFHYHGGSTYDTPFWEYSKKYGNAVMSKSKCLSDSILYIKDLQTRQVVSTQPLWVFESMNLVKVHNNLEYNYF